MEGGSGKAGSRQLYQPLALHCTLPGFATVWRRIRSSSTRLRRRHFPAYTGSGHEARRSLLRLSSRTLRSPPQSHGANTAHPAVALHRHRPTPRLLGESPANRSLIGQSLCQSRQASGARRAAGGSARGCAAAEVCSQEDASLVAAQDSAESPHAGGAEERGDVQRASGELRQLDEHQPSRGDLYIEGR